MTIAHTAPSRRGVAAEAGQPLLRDLIAPLREAWSKRRAYRTALHDLRALDVRQRDDLGVAGLDLAAVARKAAYGHHTA